MVQPSDLEEFFAPFRRNIIGRQQTFDSPFGKKEILYADWTASGRAYGPIEECIQQQIMPFLANTHTETTFTGSLMSKAYEAAKDIVKHHVHAQSDDVLIFCGSGMTAAVNKLQRLLGLRLPERLLDYVKKEDCFDPVVSTGQAVTVPRCLEKYLSLDETLRPIVFVTHMEHHSNQTSWLETIATVEIIPSDANGDVDVDGFKDLLDQYKHRKNKIAAITACSNVTGIQTPYHQIARLIHAYQGVCFVDFACSAPYVDINMHPTEKGTHLDAIYFSPHKFLGGPGTAGVLIFNQKLYKNHIPDQPGGGTILYSNPWKEHVYSTDIEQREDGGTPPILQGIKVAMCIRLKEAMGVDNIRKREDELLQIIFDRFSTMKQVHLLEGHYKNRLGVISFLVEGVHYNLVVKQLNDRFGIQTRGGCSCAGTYGHVLLQVDARRSHELLTSIQSGDHLSKPGWVRLSLHPTMTNAEMEFILDAIEWTASHSQEWIHEYTYDHEHNQFVVNGLKSQSSISFDNWFTASHWVNS
ncbi:aminotransferase class V-fold PLP-dependent enzyme [Spirosoma sp. HMF4905]|uniref:Aminotransferase class V-fold PLP-dependent enzyme n=1 Tax=Spirosoma arboris TaxID=2682092 RepID=A0A7K1SK66_9BACT|nr:aminotransferase class V-fold PLP-dependent enzyme [Spirosoma arboris]MVM34123.1 aminotransferase class V-fold PLP-dependent enzyme [Spirosoma arboris]